MIFNYIRL